MLITRFRKHVSPAMVLSLFALVLAGTGGAFAAAGSGGSHGALSASAPKKKSKPRGPRGPAGPRGATGAQGPAGAAGAKGETGPAGATGSQGPEGKEGAQGPQGEKGASGTNGANGKSVVVENEPTGTGNCGGEGGSSFHQEGSGSKTYACNGKTGYVETLPSEKTETGVYSDYIPVIPYKNVIYVPISFTIPVEGEPTSESFYLKFGETNSKCMGSNVDPTAAPNVLCVYENEGAKRSKFIEFGPTVANPDASVPGVLSETGAPYDRVGSRIRFRVEGEAAEREAEPALLQVGGAWAVTAP